MMLKNIQRFYRIFTKNWAQNRHKSKVSFFLQLSAFGFCMDLHAFAQDLLSKGQFVNADVELLLLDDVCRKLGISLFTILLVIFQPEQYFCHTFAFQLQNVDIKIRHHPMRFCVFGPIQNRCELLI